MRWTFTRAAAAAVGLALLGVSVAVPAAVAAPDPGVSDPPGTVLLPRAELNSPVTRRVLATDGTHRVLLQPDVNGTWWFWWQTGTQAPERSDTSFGTTSAVATEGVSASGGHAMFKVAGAWYSAFAASKTVQKVTLPSLVSLVAATPDGWVQWNGTASARVLERVRADGTTTTVPLDVPLTSVSTAPPNSARAANHAAADGDGVVLSGSWGGTSAERGIRWFPFDGSPSTRLAEQQYSAHAFSLSATDVTWASEAWNGTTPPPFPKRVHRVAKAGGTEHVLDITDSVLVVDGTAITGTSTAWTGPAQFVTWGGTGDHSSRLAYSADAALANPHRITGMNATSVLAEGDDVLMTDELPAADAGLYAVDAADAATLLTRTTAPVMPIRAFAYDGTRLVEQRLDATGSSTSTVTRAVSSTGVPSSVAATVSTGGGTTPLTIAASAGRVLTDGSTTLVSDFGAFPVVDDSTTLTGSARLAELSGSTAVVAGHVLDAASLAERYALPGAVTWAVFGPTVVWSTSRGEVWRRTGTAAATRLLAAGCALDCPAEVGVWGDEVVVQPLVGPLQLRRLDGSLVKTLPAIPAADSPHPTALTLEDGVLAWVEPTSGGPGVLRVMDLLAATPTPVDVARAWRGAGVRAVELRQGRLAWVSADDRGLRLAPSPITRPVHVVKVESSAAAAFSPNGDHHQDTWQLTAILTAPLAGTAFVEVLDANGGLVRRLPTGAPLGRLDVTWDGRTDGDVAAPDGPYTWRLSGTSTSGGPLAPVTGSMALRRTAPAVVVAAPQISSSVSSTGLFPVSWRTTTAQPAWSEVTYEVQARTLRGGSPRSGWETTYWPWLTGTSATGGTFDLRRFQTGSRQWQFRVRAVAPGGATGAWSSASTTIPVDDASSAAHYVTGTWARQRVAGTFMGTQHRTATAGAVVDVFDDTASSRVRVLVTTCPSCGKVRIRVDQGRWLTVDTYSRTVVRRHLVYRATLKRAQHRVTVQNLGTRGRPYLYLDGVAFETL
ncbi:FlgD immunoglobulin-like domain containing protein [Angustibacter luteus]|uniref:FlgD immunoglobulin-like domain containing protein n=1 Tax=Angustibacter luteus TaxID=658456 RepID=A0ABW1JBG7_9ACTN